MARTSWLRPIRRRDATSGFTSSRYTPSACPRRMFSSIVPRRISSRRSFTKRNAFGWYLFKSNNTLGCISEVIWWMNRISFNSASMVFSLVDLDFSMTCSIWEQCQAMHCKIRSRLSLTYLYSVFLEMPSSLDRSAMFTALTPKRINTKVARWIRDSLGSIAVVSTGSGSICGGKNRPQDACRKRKQR